MVDDAGEEEAGDISQSKQAVLEKVRDRGLALQHASAELRGDREVVLEAVRQNGESLQYASEELRADKELVIEAVKRSCRSLKWASDGLRGDDEVVEAALKAGWPALQFASKEHQANRDVVMEAVKLSGWAFQFASEELQLDQDLQLLAARSVENLWTMPLLTVEAKVQLQRKPLKQAMASSIAVQGETAPILTVRRMPLLSEDKTEDEGAASSVRCEASLMSGAKFECCPSNLRRGYPNVDDLAKALVAQLPKHFEAATARVFLNFITSDDGDAVAVTPWDWDRPLTDFLPPTS